MKSRSVVLLGLLLVVLPGVARGQCQIQTSTNYAVSYSFASDSTDSHIISSVVVDGSASMQIQSGCPVCSMYQQFQNELPYITHYPSVQNQVGSIGGWSSGPSFCAECYGSYQTTVDSGPHSDGQVVSFQYGGSIQCSIAGLIFTTATSFSIERASTLSQTTGGTSGHWSVTPYCTPAGLLAGFEPATPALEMRRSVLLSYQELHAHHQSGASEKWWD
jgi:hypothetical protein